MPQRYRLYVRLVCLDPKRGETSPKFDCKLKRKQKNCKSRLRLCKQKPHKNRRSKLHANINHIKNERKGLILVWNKWDLVEKDDRTFDEIVKYSRDEYPELQNIPMISISALTGKRAKEVLKQALLVGEDMKRQITRSDLEDNFFFWVRKNPHPYNINQKVHFMGVKQQKDRYPHFVVFCTNKQNMEESYIRYLKNNIYKTYRFKGSFVVIDFKTPGKSFGDKDSSTGDFSGVMEYDV